MGRKGLVLIIEDQIEITDILQAFVQISGYRVEAITDGKEAVDRLSTGAVPDVIFLDLHLPQVDGTEFLRLARADTNWKSVTIGVITGDKNAADALQARSPDEPRPDVVVVKPFDLEEIRSILLLAEAKQLAA